VKNEEREMKEGKNTRDGFPGSRGCLIALAAFFIFHFSFFIAPSAAAQKYPERRVARAGDRLYYDGDYEGAELRYRRALEMQPSFPEATFNLANALYRGEKAEEAARAYGAIAADSLIAADARSAASFNLGNVMLAGQKIDEAIESYKAALRLTPDDVQAKYNLAFAQKLKQQQQEQQQNQDQNQQNEGGDGEQNQQQDEQDKQQGEDNQDKQDGGQDKQDGQDEKQQGGGEQEDKPQPSGSQAGEAKIDPETAEQMLEAIQGEEDKTREKVNAREVPAVGRSGKNW
jgi:tetratricopeptide (TPR) repeat protein